MRSGSEQEGVERGDEKTEGERPSGDRSMAGSRLGGGGGRQSRRRPAHEPRCQRTQTHRYQEG